MTQSKLLSKSGAVEGILVGGAERKSGTALGALSVNKDLSIISTTGAATASLADGRFDGQVKTLLMLVDGGDCVVTPARLNGGTTITLNDVGDCVSLVWVNNVSGGFGKWFVRVNTGATVA